METLMNSQCNHIARYWALRAAHGKWRLKKKKHKTRIKKSQWTFCSKFSRVRQSATLNGKIDTRVQHGFGGMQNESTRDAGWQKCQWRGNNTSTGKDLLILTGVTSVGFKLTVGCKTENRRIKTDRVKSGRINYGGEYWTKLLLDRVPSSWGIKSYCTVMYPVVLYRTLYVLLYGMSLCRTTCCYKSFPIMLYHTRRAPVDVLSGQRQVHGVRAHILPTTVVPFPTWNSLSTWRALLFNYSTFLSLRAYINL